MWERNDADLDAEEHITAQAALTYFLSSRGLTLADLSVRPVVLAAFQPRLHRHLLRLTGAVPAPVWTEPERVPLAHGAIAGRPVSVILLPIGAPWTILICEQLIAAGARAIIAAGAAGSLQPSAPIGTFVVPERAIREEGTSYHYVPPEFAAEPAPELADDLVTRCREHGVEPVRGLNWTTDAPFREMRPKVERYAARGVVTVDMEAAAMFVLGRVRRVAVASLLIVSDELFRPWRPAFFDRHYLERVALAAEVLVETGAAWATRFPEAQATPSDEARPD